MLLGYGAQVEFKGGKVNFKISIVIYSLIIKKCFSLLKICMILHLNRLERHLYISQQEPGMENDVPKC